jgi:hypothetical protein
MIRWALSGVFLLLTKKSDESSPIKPRISRSAASIDPVQYD